jgi:acetylglutamate kinase
MMHSECYAHVLPPLTKIQHNPTETILIKLGGSILTDMTLVQQLCREILLLRSHNFRFVIVHGGGQAINRVLDVYQIKSTFHQGLRVTTDEMMTIIEMVLCGQVNQMLVRTLNSLGVAAVGLSGADHGLLQCDFFSVHHGRVGQIQHVDTTVVDHFVNTQHHQQGGIIPVIAPVGLHQNGQALNINADFAASECAVALGIKKIIYVTDQDGIYDAAKNRIAACTLAQLQKLIDDRIVTEGMLAKVRAMINALAQGVSCVHVINGQRSNALLTALVTEDDRTTGTVCQLVS